MNFNRDHSFLILFDWGRFDLWPIWFWADLTCYLIYPFDDEIKHVKLKGQQRGQFYLLLFHDSISHMHIFLAIMQPIPVPLILNSEEKVVAGSLR